MGAAKRYVGEVHARWGYLATWLPNTPVKLGDVVTKDGYGWKVMASLEELGIPFKVRQGKDAIDFDQTSSSGVRVTETLEAGLGGASARVGEGKLSIEFAEEGSFLFRAVGCRVAEIEDRAALGRAILDQGGMWDKDWSVVDAVVRAASCTIVVCNSGTAAVTLGAKGPVQLSGIADAEAGLSITAKSGDVLSFLAAKGLTPLFKLSRVKHSWVQKLVGAAPTFGGVSPSASMPASDDDNPLEAVEPE